MIKLFLFVVLSVGSPNPRFIASKEEIAFVNLVNNRRISHNLPCLRLDYYLSAVCYFNNKQQRFWGVGDYTNRFKSVVYVADNSPFPFTVLDRWFGQDTIIPRYSSIGVHFDGYFWTVIIE